MEQFTEASVEIDPTKDATLDRATRTDIVTTRFDEFLATTKVVVQLGGVFGKEEKFAGIQLTDEEKDYFANRILGTTASELRQTLLDRIDSTSQTTPDPAASEIPDLEDPLTPRPDPR